MSASLCRQIPASAISSRGSSKMLSLPGLRRIAIGIVLTVVFSAGLGAQVFFEAPRAVTPSPSVHPLLLSTGDQLYLFTQTVVGPESFPQTQVQMQVSEFGRDWGTPIPVGEPVQFIADSPPRVFDANWDGRSLMVAVLEDQDLIRAYRIQGSTVTPGARLRAESALVVPELSSLSAGGHLLIVAQQVLLAEEVLQDSEGNQVIERRAVQNLFGAVSGNGSVFGPLEPLVFQEVLPSPEDQEAESAAVLGQETEGSFLQVNLSPVHVSGADGELVVFQSRNDRTGRFHLWAKSGVLVGSGTNARIQWSLAVRLTDFPEPRALDPDSAGPLNFENESPDAVLDADGTLRLAWERRQRPGGVSRAAYMAYAADSLLAATADLARPAEDSGLVPDEFRYLDSGGFPVDRPRFAETSGREPVVFWTRDPFGTPRMRYRDLAANPEQVRSLADVSAFNHSAVFHPDLDDGSPRAHVAWEGGPGPNFRVIAAEPDQTADPPILRPLNFRAGRRSPLDEAQIAWRAAPDASGVQAYSVIWTRNEQAIPPEVSGLSPDQTEVSVGADTDGPWYLAVRTLDLAGNWSPPGRIRFFRDTTPPPPVTLDRPVVDEDGFLASNTLTVQWQPPDDQDLAGYSLRWTRLGPERLDPPTELIQSIEPGTTVQTAATAFSRQNEDNGTWVLAVAPVDRVGNVGPARRLLVRLNKYIPVTIISRIEVREDFLGEPVLDVVGRGFTSDGTISRILIDADGQAPFDYVLERQEGDFSLDSDRVITGIGLAGIGAGSFRLILDHSTRGLETASEELSFDRRGLVRLGDFRIEDLLAVRFSGRAQYILGADSVVTWIVLVLAGAAVVLAAVRIRSSVREARQLRQDVRRLIARESLSEEEAERQAQLRHKGLGLRTKFAFFIVVIVIGVVAIVALPLSVFSIETQEETLTEGLRSNVAVLLESLASTSRGLLQNPGGNVIALASVPSQRDALEASRYVTITGRGALVPVELQGTEREFGYVWATDDAVLRDPGARDAGNLNGSSDAERTLIGADGGFIPGLIQIEDPASGDLQEWALQIDTEARERLGDIPTRIAELTSRLQDFTLAEFNAREAGNSARAAEIAARIREEQRERNELTVQLNSILREVVGSPRSVPALESQTLSPQQTEYLFYVPVVGRDPADDPQTARYFRGAVRMGVSSQGILANIGQSQRIILERIAVAAVIGVVVGIAAALVIAYLVVVPILRLVDTVTVIRETQDKEDLKTLEVKVPSRDELQTLGQALEALAHDLGEAEKQAKEVKVGKEIQQAFIPLKPDGRKHGQTIAQLQEGGIEVFGYYEGASGVSGDYFDFERISDSQWALIKSDSSGHGIPAGLIATMVATLFRNELELWKRQYARKPVSPGAISAMVGRINDLVVERGFTGMFATLFAPVLDTRTGGMRFCYAGDNDYRIFRRSANRVEEVQFGTGETLPAAGTFETEMLPNGFPEKEDRLEKGDALTLFTDGFEDSEYYFRDSSLARVSHPASRFTDEFVDNAGLTAATRENPDIAVYREQFGSARVAELVNAAFRGELFVFRRTLGLADEELILDFSGLPRNPETVALGMVAAATVFRIQPHPHGLGDRPVRVDRNIDNLLRQCFNRYARYFGHPLPDRDRDSQYVWFTHLLEDEQPDDLTVLIVRRI